MKYGLEIYATVFGGAHDKNYVEGVPVKDTLYVAHGNTASHERESQFQRRLVLRGALIRQTHPPVTAHDRPGEADRQNSARPANVLSARGRGVRPADPRIQKRIVQAR